MFCKCYITHLEFPDPEFVYEETTWANMKSIIGFQTSYN
jgi:hypothetical protein